MPLEDVVDIGHEFHALFGFAIQEAKTDGIELRIWLLAAIANLGLHFDRLFAALSDGKDALRPFLDFLAATRLHPAKADIDDHRGYWSWLTCQPLRPVLRSIRTLSYDHEEISNICFIRTAGGLPAEPRLLAIPRNCFPIDSPFLGQSWIQ